jgi:hypothetical protein
VLTTFGIGTPQRAAVATRLARIHALATSTGHVRRFIVFGSFITAKPEPNDVDVFLLMDDSFEVSHVRGGARLVFEHAAADARFGARVFWLRLRTALGGEDEAVQHWQIKRDGTRRGIIEVIPEAP